LALKLSLKPGEKFVLNGAVVQNGDRRGVLILQNKASVLREKDINTIPKAGTTQHVEENRGALSMSLTKEDLAELDRAFPAPKKKMPLELI